MSLNEALLVTVLPMLMGGLATAALSPPSAAIQHSYRDFQFAPGRSCETGWIDISFCEATEPKPWQPDELKQLERFMESIYLNKVDVFLETVVTKGFNTLYRYGHSFKPAGATKFARDEHGAWVWGSDRSINFSDMVVSAQPLLDPIGGFELKKLALLHELAHAFSYDEPDLMADFINLAGWARANDGWVLSNVDMQVVQATVLQMRTLVLAGKLEEGLRVSREFGLRHGFPTVIAMTTPRECFAEIAAYILFDSDASKYLRPEYIEWFRLKVLK